jgi:hypothetical protein
MSRPSNQDQRLTTNYNDAARLLEAGPGEEDLLPVVEQACAKQVGERAGEDSLATGRRW